MFNSSYNLRTIAMPLVFITPNKAIVTRFALQSLEIKVTTIEQMSHIPFNIHSLNVQMTNKQLANVGCTYITMLFSTKLGRTFSIKAFFYGKTIHGHSLYDNL